MFRYYSDELVHSKSFETDDRHLIKIISQFRKVFQNLLIRRKSEKYIRN